MSVEAPTQNAASPALPVSTSPLPDLAVKDWRFSVDVEGIAWAVIDREGESANTLGRRVLVDAVTGAVIATGSPSQTRGVWASMPGTRG